MSLKGGESVGAGKTKYLKRIVAGPEVYEVIYTPPARWDNSKQRAQKLWATTEAQAHINFKTSRKKLELLLAANFTERDSCLTLTYNEQSLPSSRSEAQGHIRYFLRRLRDLRKKMGVPLKYVYAIEHKHGAGRWHFHLVVNVPAAMRAKVFALWPYGSGGNQEMKSLERDSTGFVTYRVFAEYLTKEGAEGKRVGDRMWTPSKNLAKPVVTGEWVSAARHLKVPVNCVVIDELRSGRNGEGCYEYVAYFRAVQNKRPAKRNTGGQSSGRAKTHKKETESNGQRSHARSSNKTE